MHVGFNNFQFDYNKGVPEQALLTKTRNLFQQRYKRNSKLIFFRHRRDQTGSDWQNELLWQEVLSSRFSRPGRVRQLFVAIGYKPPMKC